MTFSVEQRLRYLADLECSEENFGSIPPMLLTEAADRIAELDAENFALAAHQCQSPAGDEFGHFYCARIAELEARIAELQARRWSMSENQR